MLTSTVMDEHTICPSEDKNTFELPTNTVKIMNVVYFHYASPHYMLLSCLFRL